MHAASPVHDSSIQLHAVLLRTLGPPDGLQGRVESPFQDPPAEHLNVSLGLGFLCIDGPYGMLEEVEARCHMAEEEQSRPREERVNRCLVGVCHFADGEAKRG